MSFEERKVMNINTIYKTKDETTFSDRITDGGNLIVEFELIENHLKDEEDRVYPFLKWHDLKMVVCGREDSGFHSDLHLEVTLNDILPQGIDKIISYLRDVNKRLKKATYKQRKEKKKYVTRKNNIGRNKTRNCRLF